jgi:hypothetical protein
MSLTALGCVLLPLGLFLFARGSRALFWAVVVSAPFFDTAVLELPAFTTALRPAQYFGALFLLRRFLTTSPRSRFRPDVVELFALVFLVIAAGASFMPAVLGSSIEVIPNESSVATQTDIDYSTLAYTRNSITQLLYPFFYVFCFIALCRYIRRWSLARPVVRALVLLSIPIVLSGLLELYLVSSGKLAWRAVLRSALGQMSGGSLGLEDPGSGILRMRSLAGEPGYTGFYCLICLGPLAASLITADYSQVGGRARTIALFAALVLALVLGGGTTGFVGLSVTALVVMVLLVLHARSASHLVLRHARWIFPLACLIVFVAGGYQLMLGETFLTHVSQVHLAKLFASAGSGMVREEIALHNMATFVESPVLGVGYGNDRSLAMSTFLLANTGILGFTAFLAFLLSVAIRPIKVLRSRTESAASRNLALGIAISFVSTCIVLQFAQSESSLLFMYLWVLVAVCAAQTTTVPNSGHEVGEEACDPVDSATPWASSAPLA